MAMAGLSLPTAAFGYMIRQIDRDRQITDIGNLECGVTSKPSPLVTTWFVNTYDIKQQNLKGYFYLIHNNFSPRVITTFLEL